MPECVCVCACKYACMYERVLIQVFMHICACECLDRWPSRQLFMYAGRQAAGTQVKWTGGCRQVVTV